MIKKPSNVSRIWKIFAIHLPQARVTDSRNVEGHLAFFKH